jgi:5-methyltetrahydrofolate--homocysteine methyltransferase
MSSICNEIKNGRILVSDGAWGTFLHQKGLRGNECPELWNITHRDAVLDIARSYIDAGANIIETNSFGASRTKLAGYGLGNRATELNEAAAAISREAAGTDGYVLGSIGPTGKMLLTNGISSEELYAVFKEQAQALDRGGVDAICIETMIELEEAVIAIKAAKENTALDVICTMTFGRTKAGKYRSIMGVSPTASAIGLVEAGADIIGTNCGNGMEGMIDIVREIRSVNSEVPLLVHANAGLPRVEQGQTIFPEGPKDTASRVKELVAAGANIVGGCCGTTPDHIREIVKKVASL